MPQEFCHPIRKLRKTNMKTLIFPPFFLFLSSFLFMHNSKTIRPTQTFYIHVPNEFSTSVDAPFLVYNCVQVTTGELWPQACITNAFPSRCFVRKLRPSRFEVVNVKLFSPSAATLKKDKCFRCATIKLS